MNKVSVIPGTATQTANNKLSKSKPDSYFFAGMAILFLVITFFGFFPSFQSMQEGTLQVHWLTHIHSAIMTCWLLLYLTQAMLVATGNLRIHRQLGILSFVIGILVFIVMGLVSFHILIVNHPPEGSFLFDLLLIDFYEMLCFALFFTWGMRLRKKDPGAHKRLLTLATFILLTAAVDRIQRNNAFPSLEMEYPAFSFMYLDILLIPIFLQDIITLKRIHKITWLGTAIIIFLQVIVSNAYNSPAWHRFWFKATAPLMNKVVEINLSNIESAPLLGNYESALGNITISRNNDKLYIQFNEEEKQELGATSATQLYLKGETMNFFFVKGTDGKVTTAEARQIGRVFKMFKVK
ncbi:MAG: hypothetical protein IT249_14840 [Chitinophagaceae bacterium]|nr:hypothetical protein [Chitinophagaceae bacterium]